MKRSLWAALTSADKSPTESAVRIGEVMTIVIMTAAMA